MLALLIHHLGEHREVELHDLLQVRCKSLGGDLGPGDPDEAHHLHSRLGVGDALVERLEEGEREKAEEDVGDRIDAIEDPSVQDSEQQCIDNPLHRGEPQEPEKKDAAG